MATLNISTKTTVVITKSDGLEALKITPEGVFGPDGVQLSHQDFYNVLETVAAEPEMG